MGKRKQPLHVTPTSVANILTDCARASDIEKARTKGSVIHYTTKDGKITPDLDTVEYHKSLVADCVAHNKGNI